MTNTLTRIEKYIEQSEKRKNKRRTSNSNNTRDISLNAHDIKLYNKGAVKFKNKDVVTNKLAASKNTT